LSKQYSESLLRYGLAEFKPEWASIQRGIEKESLRVTRSGEISLQPHPKALGSALTNPYITTDFSEALLEFITPVYESVDDCLNVLEQIHRFTLQHLDAEQLLWVASMPCPLGREEDIPIAQYGDSNIGRMKTLYRHGLHHRYGSLMQVISGIHYNFSMPDVFWPEFQRQLGHGGSLQDFKTDRYLHLIRNFHRYSWLLIYLFGASPAACKCFAQGREHGLEELDKKTLYLPYATCLRMGNLGYKSEAQKSLFVCYNELETYVKCLHDGIHTPFPPYEKIGQGSNGEYRQINTNLLQLENEFYSTIRPKPKLNKGDRPLAALARSGIEYIEVRALDLNPYLPLGIDAEQIRFLDSFLLHCLLAESPACDKREFFEVGDNIARVVESGRDPELELKEVDSPRKMRDWASSLLADIEHSAGLLDHLHACNAYGSSLEKQKQKLANPDLTPSGRMLTDMKSGQLSFFDFAMTQSGTLSDSLRQNKLDAATLKQLQLASQKSLAQLREVEAGDGQTFEEYLRDWNKH